MAIIAIPVPAAARAEMQPILALLRTQTAIMKRSFTQLAAQDTAGISASLRKVDEIGQRADKLLDAAGLADCGSRQTLLISHA